MSEDPRFKERQISQPVHVDQQINDSVPETFVTMEQPQSVTTQVEKDEAPVVIDTEQQRELQEAVSRHIDELTVQYSAEVEFKPVDSLPPKSEFKAKSKRKRRLEESRSTNVLLDEAGVFMEQEIPRSNEYYRRMSANTDALYAGRNRFKEERALHYFNLEVKFNSKGEPLTETDRINYQLNYNFHRDYLSGNANARKPHLDRITRDIINLRIHPDMLTPAYIEKHPAQAAVLTAKLTNFMDIQKNNPEYFAGLPQFEKDLLADIGIVEGELCAYLALMARTHGIDITTGKQLEDTRTLERLLPEQIEFITPRVTEKMEAFVKSRRETLQREADRRAVGAGSEGIAQPLLTLSVQAIGAGAYKYGLPSPEDIDEIIKQAAGLNDQQLAALNAQPDIVLMRQKSSEFFALLERINKNAPAREAMFTDLVNAHNSFLRLAAGASRSMSELPEAHLRKAAGALGFIAMKSMSYSGSIINLEADFEYTNAMGETSSLKERMAAGNVGKLYEGEHRGQSYADTDPDGVAIPRMSDKIRELIRARLDARKDIPDAYKAMEDDLHADNEMTAILLTIVSYENFLDNAQVPPCVTEEDKLAYPARIQELSDKLLAYNDRITARALSYLDRHANHREKRYLCSILKQTVLQRDVEDSNFERVAELMYRLSHNDFSNDEFNKSYTGVMISKALSMTRITPADVMDDDYDAKGGALSVVYIPKSRTGHVYRRGNAYRPFKAIRSDIQHDLDRFKGGLRVFKVADESTFTGVGLVVDSHKASRDVAVSRVDKLLGAGVIAESEHVRIQHKTLEMGDDGLEYEKVEETVGSKMELAQGREAADYMDTAEFDLSVLRNTDRELSTSENDVLNLAHPESMLKIYWLQVVDVICGSADRHLGNFFIQTDKRGAITGLTGIDNDMSFGEDFIPMQSLLHRHDFDRRMGNRLPDFGPVTPVFDLAFPCIPLEIYEKVMALTPQALAQELRGSVRDSELQMTVSRLQALKIHLGHVPKYDFKRSGDVAACATKTREAAKAVHAKASISDNMSYAMNNYFTMLGFSSF